jgi:hypothetical protein
MVYSKVPYRVLLGQSQPCAYPPVKPRQIGNYFQSAALKREKTVFLTKKTAFIASQSDV